MQATGPAGDRTDACCGVLKWATSGWLTCPHPAQLVWPDTCTVHTGCAAPATRLQLQDVLHELICLTQLMSAACCASCGKVSAHAHAPCCPVVACWECWGCPKQLASQARDSPDDAHLIVKGTPLPHPAAALSQGAVQWMTT